MTARRSKAVSVRQPWAHFVAHGLKSIEVRSWDPGYRGKLLIHASKKLDQRAQRYAATGDARRERKVRRILAHYYADFGHG